MKIQMWSVDRVLPFNFVCRGEKKAEGTLAPASA